MSSSKSSDHADHAWTIADWDKRFRHVKTLGFHVWSPQEHEALRPLWQELDEVDQRCRRKSRDQTPLMKALTFRRKQQRKYDRRRQSVVISLKEIPSLDWSECPLWMHLERHGMPVNHKFPWIGALESWEKFRECFARSDAFRNTLPTSQRASYEALGEWWESTYTKPTLVESVRKTLRSRAERREWNGTPGEKSIFTADIMEEIQGNMCIYHTKCFMLFAREFFPLLWQPFRDPYGDQAMLNTHRQRVMLECNAVCLSHYALANVRLTITSPIDTWSQRERSQWDRETGLPFYLWDVEQRCTVEVAELRKRSSSFPGYVCVSHTWGRWRIPGGSAPVAGVPWPVPTTALWDVEDLPDMLGNLRDGGILGSRGKPYVWFDLFCIPQIDADKIRANTNVDPRERDLQRRAAAEIGRQSGIFKGAATCVAWFNDPALDLRGWDNVRNAMRFMALQFLLRTFRPGSLLADTPSTSNALDSASRAAGEDINIALSSWFTSLWTLQELLMRPDLLLISRDWEVFGFDKGALVSLYSLNGFIALVRTYLVETDPPGDLTMCDPVFYIQTYTEHEFRPSSDGGYVMDGGHLPLAVQRLLTFEDKIIIERVAGRQVPVAEVFHMADQREYTGVKVEGIMSALEATYWYNELLKRAEDPTQLFAGGDLVNSMYPKAFVDEIVRKYQGLFFLHFWGGAPSDWLTAADFSQPGRPPKPRGSLLPFSPSPAASGQQWYVFPERQQWLKSHDAVATWEVLGTGAVRMSKAGILALASTDLWDGDPELEGLVYFAAKPGHKAQSAIFFCETLNLLTTLRERAAAVAGSMLFAVTLAVDPNGCQKGVILQTFLDPPGAVKGVAYLVNVGGFETQDGFSMAPIRDVNWVAL